METVFFDNAFQEHDGALLKLPKQKGSWGHKIQIESKITFQKPNENIWGNTPETLTILVGPDGIGYYHTVPSGYSSYTYDPEETQNFYYTKDLDYFLRFALNQELREMIPAQDLETLKSFIRKLK